MIFFFSKFLTQFLESEVLVMEDIGPETGNEVPGFSSSAHRTFFCPTESYNHGVKEQCHTITRGKTLLSAQSVWQAAGEDTLPQSTKGEF